MIRRAVVHGRGSARARRLARRLALRAALVAGAVALPLFTAGAQVKVPMPANAPHVCDGRLLLLSVRVTDRHGAPVEGAVITVRSVKTGKLVSRSRGQNSVNGYYMVMDDSYQPQLAKNGNEYDVIATHGKAQGRTRWRVGMDRGGCHLTRLDGAESIALG